jgi:hypothetical protein
MRHCGFLCPIGNPFVPMAHHNTSIADHGERTTIRAMAMGKRKRDRQPAMWVTTTDLPTAASHPFYRRLNQLLREHGFDDFVEAQCASFYAETMGRPGLPPGIYFRLLLTATSKASTQSAASRGTRRTPSRCVTFWASVWKMRPRTTRRFRARGD